MTVTIPLKRYESLLDSETRRVVLRDYLNRNNYMEREAMMRILGYLKRRREDKRPGGKGTPVIFNY